MVGMNPLTEERLDQLKDSAAEFGKTFGKEYLKMFALGMFNRIKEDIEGGADQRQLTYRDWKNVERPDVFTGECFMRSGEGAGTFGGWNAVYLVEQKDYNLAVYADEKSYTDGKKPKKLIRMCGYSVESEPSAFYKSEMKSVCHGLGLTDEEAAKLTMFSPYAWALAHPVRTNYIFQLHKGSGGGMCACLGGGSTVEPEDAGSEFAAQRDKYISIFQRCTSYSSPRDLASVSGRGFGLTVVKMKGNFDRLSSFEDDGMEAEILTDMMMIECLGPLQDGILQDMMGPASMKLALWYKTRGIIFKTLQAVADPVWGGVQKGAQELGEKIEPKVRMGLEPILQVKEDLKNKIRESLIESMGKFLQKYVTPHIDPLLKSFDAPMTKGFEEAKEVCSTHINIGALSDDPKQRNMCLDNIPRQEANIHAMSAAAEELTEPLRKLQSQFGEIFGDMNPEALKNQAQMLMLEVLDAAVYTLQLRIDESGKDENMKNQILEEMDHDIILARSTFVKTVVKTLLIIGFRKAIGPVADPVIEQLDGFIPEDVQDFVSVAGTFEELVDLFVGEPIEKMVEGAYPPPPKKQLAE